MPFTGHQTGASGELAAQPSPVRLLRAAGTMVPRSQRSAHSPHPVPSAASEGRLSGALGWSVIRRPRRAIAFFPALVTLFLSFTAIQIPSDNE